MQVDTGKLLTKLNLTNDFSVILGTKHPFLLFFYAFSAKAYS